MLSIIRIRYYQLKNTIKDIGIGYSLFLFFILLGAFIEIYVNSKNISNISNNLIINELKFFLFITLVVILFYLHNTRKDREFIETTIGGAYNVFLAEYLLINIPFFIFFISFKGFEYLFILIFFVIVISSTHLSFNKFFLSNKHLYSFWVGQKNYEWRAGLKRLGFLLMLFWVCSIILCGYPYATLVALLLIVSVITKFYEKCEPLIFIQAQELNASNFLHQKVILQNTILLKFVALPFILHIVFCPSELFLGLIFLLFLSLIMCWIIFVKYANYTPEDSFSISVRIRWITSLGIMIIFILPLFFILLIRYYFLALKNLKNYIDVAD
ncbi:MAG: hypothetical protein HC913_04790 [Microscillaceae bacterium]|nr:hypothetical protein [Microscillaceae bacterium]